MAELLILIGDSLHFIIVLNRLSLLVNVFVYFVGVLFILLLFCIVGFFFCFFFFSGEAYLCLIPTLAWQATYLVFFPTILSDPHCMCIANGTCGSLLLVLFIYFCC